MSISKVLLAAAAAVFAQYAEPDEVYVTEDGNAFLPVAKHLASTHARLNKLPEPVCITRQQMQKLDQMKGIVQGVSKAVNDAADRMNREKEEADAEAARKAADDAAAAAQAEEAARKAAENSAPGAEANDVTAATSASALEQQQAADAARELAAQDAAQNAQDATKAKDEKPATNKGGGKKGK